MQKLLRLKGITRVYTDWANVYGWRKSLKREVSPVRLYKYLRSYSEIAEIKFYYGADDHSKSKRFLRNIRRIGYTVSTKPVKYIKTENGKQIRKCDFDLEIAIDVMRSLFCDNVDSYIFFSGDGDFAALYKELVAEGKQVIVIYGQGHLGREIYQVSKIYKLEVERIGVTK